MHPRRSILQLVPVAKDLEYAYSIRDRVDSLFIVASFAFNLMLAN